MVLIHHIQAKIRVGSSYFVWYAFIFYKVFAIIQIKKVSTIEKGVTERPQPILNNPHNIYETKASGQRQNKQCMMQNTIF